MTNTDLDFTLHLRNPIIFFILILSLSLYHSGCDNFDSCFYGNQDNLVCTVPKWYLIAILLGPEYLIETCSVDITWKFHPPRLENVYLICQVQFSKNITNILVQIGFEYICWKSLLDVRSDSQNLMSIEYKKF